MRFRRGFRPGSIFGCGGGARFCLRRCRGHRSLPRVRGQRPREPISFFFRSLLVAQRARGLMLALALGVALAACSSQGGRQGPGGVPAALTAKVSLVVAQTRSQFPELSGADIPYDAITPPDAASAGEPELALQGSGVGVEPGLQTGSRPHALVALYLDKRAYARGTLELTPQGQPAERWSIVAYDQVGSPAKSFSFTYVMANPAGQLRYLVLIGGRYRKDGADWLGYEGTLIQPGPDNDLERWVRAFKLDFGYRLPLVPAYQPKVEQAERLFSELGRSMARLERLREGLSAAEGDLATLRSSEVPPEQAARRGQRIADVQARLDAQRGERDALVKRTQAAFVEYYGLRQAIAGDYAAFTRSNRYLWLDTDGRQEFYDRWKVVEFHHPRIDTLVSDFLTVSDQGGPVLDARKAAMAAVTEQDNWAKDPSRSGKTRPR